MPVYKVNVKWNKQVLSVDLNTDEEPRLFKAQLYAMTSVAIDRQKVLFKGKQIHDDSWNNLAIKDGVTLLMMGSQYDIPKEPVTKTVFMEDLSENKLTQLLNLPAGLENLVQALKDLFDSMEKQSVVKPNLLIPTLLSAVPRFAENQQNGVFQQQDANECWTELLRLIRSELKQIENPIQDDNSPKYDSFIDQYLGGSNEVMLKCTETDDEEPSVSKENFLQLSCFISNDVKYLVSGLKAKLEEHLTKHSPKLSRDAIYTKSSKISRLPSYLSIQMVRLCSTDLQNKLIPMRSKFKEQEDRMCEVRVKNRSAGDDENKDEKKDDKEDMYAYPTYFKDDLGSNNSGFYELQAVLTHKGRSSSTGHYVAWIKKNKNWFKCDDDEITPVSEEEILKLSGGGDCHCAYVLLYGSKQLIVEKNADGTPMY